MFRLDRIGRMGGGVILYMKESIETYEIKLYCDEAVCCNIVTGNLLASGLIYRSPRRNEHDNTKIQNAIKMLVKGMYHNGRF